MHKTTFLKLADDVIHSEEVICNGQNPVCAIMRIHYPCGVVDKCQMIDVSGLLRVSHRWASSSTCDCCTGGDLSDGSYDGIASGLFYSVYSY